jgi:predicted nucleic acid-binding protein
MPARSAVVDAWAALAFLRGERPAESVVRRYLRRAFRGNLRVLMNLVNLGEVYYRMHRIAGEVRALEWLNRLRKLPIEIVPARESLVLEAARLEAGLPNFVRGCVCGRHRKDRARQCLDGRSGDPRVASRCGSSRSPAALVGSSR